MSKLTGQALAQFALTKVGTPYVYGAKGADGVFTQRRLNLLAKAYSNVFTRAYINKAERYVGKVCCDCSGLISWYTKKVLGSYNLYATASRRGLIADIKKAPIGAILWKSGHVGVYLGNGYCVEAKGINYGTVKTLVSRTHFTHWLVFESYMSYGKIETVHIVKKGRNPFTTPTSLVEFGDLGTSVRWVQWELTEAGIATKIDGDFGSNTEKHVRTFQQSCKLYVDGQVGAQTRKAFMNN